MEEQVGELWHRLVTRIADTHHPEARVHLAEVERSVAVLFRALGGDGGLQVTTSEAGEDAARRGWLQRLAGSNRKLALAWRDETFLRLPAHIDWFADKALNRELYLWLAALAVGDDAKQQDWLIHNQALSQQTLARFPGLKGRYDRLVAAHLTLRPDARRLPPGERAVEQSIVRALQQPGSVAQLPASKRPPQAVPLWLHPQPPRLARSAPAGHQAQEPQTGAGRQKELERLRRRAERVAEPDSDRGLITVRMENIFTWGEHVAVDRGSEDEDDLERAESVARDIDKLAVSRSPRRSAATLKFDLDLPSEADDDLVLDDGILLPEWDWKKQRLLADHCRVVTLLAADAPPCALPDSLRRTARRLRNQFQSLAPARVWHRAQADGQEADIDAYLRYRADRAAGHGDGDSGLYRDMRVGSRDLAALLLADLSLSTDSWINDHQRVIDVIRDSLFLFAESLAATGDRFSLYGFSSRKRDPVRLHRLKGFDEVYNGAVRGRIQAIKPGYYTRMGAAIRHGSSLLSQQPSDRRLLLLLTDGKPNDLDKYEGRYGIEDTRQAVIEARRQGLRPFCVTIDKEANDYLPHLFGKQGYLVIRNPAELPGRLPLLYAQLTV